MRESLVTPKQLGAFLAAWGKFLFIEKRVFGYLNIIGLICLFTYVVVSRFENDDIPFTFQMFSVIFLIQFFIVNFLSILWYATKWCIRWRNN
jgi:hypothetical protein